MNAKSLGCAVIICMIIITACTSGGVGISTNANLVVSSSEKSVHDPTGIVWKWTRTIYNNDTEIFASDSGSYTLELLPDGQLSVRADCNRGGGTYKLNGSEISIEITHSTMAACPEGSFEKPYIRDLNSAAISFINEGNLYLDLKHDTGTMRFSR